MSLHQFKQFVFEGKPIEISHVEIRITIDKNPHSGYARSAKFTAYTVRAGKIREVLFELAKGERVKELPVPGAFLRNSPHLDLLAAGLQLATGRRVYHGSVATARWQTSTSAHFFRFEGS